MYLTVTVPITLSNIIVVCLYLQVVSMDKICSQSQSAARLPMLLFQHIN